MAPRTGFVRSTMNVIWLMFDGLPARSLCVIVTVCEPAGRAEYVTPLASQVPIVPPPVIAHVVVPIFASLTEYVSVAVADDEYWPTPAIAETVGLTVSDVHV